MKTPISRADPVGKVAGVMTNSILAMLKQGSSISEFSAQHSTQLELMSAFASAVEKNSTTDNLIALFEKIKNPGIAIIHPLLNRLLDESLKWKAQNLVSDANKPRCVAQGIETKRSAFNIKINKHFSSIKPDKLSSTQKINYATILARMNRTEEAAGVIAKAYEQDDSLKNWYAQVGWQVFLKDKDYAKAAEWIEKDLPVEITKEESQTHFPRSLRLSPLWRLRSAHILLITHQPEKARWLLKKIIHKFDKLPPSDFALLLSALIRLGKEQEAYLLTKKATKTLPSPQRIEMTVKLLHPLMMAGHRTFVKNLVADIPAIQIKDSQLLMELVSAWMYLDEYERAEQVFVSADQSHNTWNMFYLYKANFYLCLHDYEQMAAAIESDINIHGETSANVFHKARHALYAGNYWDTIRYADDVLVLESDEEKRACATHILKGLAQRAMGQIEISLNTLSVATGQRLSFPWIWIAHFEHAITLLYRGKHRESEISAEVGAGILSPQHNSWYNPCVFLVSFFKSNLQYSGHPSNNLGDLVSRARSWPYPHISEYRVWMLILSVAITHNQDGASLFSAIWSTLADDPAFPQPIRKEQSGLADMPSTLPDHPGIITCIANALAPNRADHTFEKSVLARIVERRK